MCGAPHWAADVPSAENKATSVLSARRVFRRRRSSENGPPRQIQSRHHLKTAVYLAVSCSWMNHPCGGRGKGRGLLSSHAGSNYPGATRCEDLQFHGGRGNQFQTRRWFECCGSSACWPIGGGGVKLSSLGSLVRTSRGGEKTRQRTPPSKPPLRIN